MNPAPRLVQEAGLQKAGFSRGKFAFSTIPSMDPAAFLGPLWVVGTQGSVSTMDQGLGAARGSAGLCLDALCTGLSGMELMGLQGFSQLEGKNGEFGCKSGCGKTQVTFVTFLSSLAAPWPLAPCRAVAGTCGAEDQKLLERIGRHHAQPIRPLKTPTWL